MILTISTTLTDGGAILKERVEAVVAEGFKGVSGGEVLSNPGGYFINNYFERSGLYFIWTYKFSL